MWNDFFPPKGNKMWVAIVVTLVSTYLGVDPAVAAAMIGGGVWAVPNG